ncbi:heavy-metal-associated domain-containing protein [Arthrobacter castelli]|uniref:heavy-metal-associated domain-containing protein n=1 Tax=Arthrobacter castelli TaxID=271431 RepID=UPI00047B22E1|nr:cation transporter [Arthrobacter castelli]
MATTEEFTVSGMTCGHCEMSVREEIEEIAGVTGVDVSHQSGKLVVTSETGVDQDMVLRAVEEAGYQAVPA